MKRILSLLLVLALSVAAFTACAPSAPAPAAAETPVATEAPAPAETPAPAELPASERAAVRIAALKGPTGMGMVKLMSDAETDSTKNDYEFTLSGAPDEIVGLLTTGAVDVAAVPTNLAAVLYNKTKGAVQMAALNTLGVLYIVEMGDTINSVEDLKGKTVTAAGQGSTPEYILNYILDAYGIRDSVTVDYKSEHAEVSTLGLSGKADVLLLPEPFVTSTLLKSDKARIALDLTKEWETAAQKAGKSGVVSMGCIVVRKAFADENKEALNAFLDEYKASTEYVNANAKDAAALIEKYGIMASAAAAEKSLPNCNIVFIEGGEMKQDIAGFLEALYAADPSSVGGAMPADDFYYMR